jgi:RNA recognition motif-containing protein
MEENYEPTRDQHIGVNHDSESPQIRTKKIFVGGLPHSTTDSEFRSYFEPFGTITDAQVMTDRETGRPRGFGFVSFDSEAVVDTIMTLQHEIGGKVVELKRAEPKRPLQLSFTANSRDSNSKDANSRDINRGPRDKPRPTRGVSLFLSFTDNLTVFAAERDNFQRDNRRHRELRGDRGDQGDRGEWSRDRDERDDQNDTYGAYGLSSMTGSIHYPPSDNSFVPLLKKIQDTDLAPIHTLLIAHPQITHQVMNFHVISNNIG